MREHQERKGVWYRASAPKRRCRLRGARKASRRLRFEPLDLRHLLAAMPQITEFLALNDQSLLDGHGDSSDWIELHNAGDELIDLAGWYLTDDADSLNKWQFPSDHPQQTQLAPGEFRVVFASGEAPNDGFYVDPSGYLHTSFSLRGAGEYLALVGPNRVVSEYGRPTSDFPTQYTDISYGSDPLTGAAVYFIDPTPGAANGQGYPGIVTQGVTFSHSSYNFQDAFDLQLSTSLATGTIRYTLDGTVPNELSMAYDGPLSIRSTMQVRARVFQDDLGPGPVHSESFVHLASDVANFQSPLPILVIENFAAGRFPNKRAHNPPAGDGGGIQQVQRQSVQLHLLERNEGTSSLAAVPDVTTRAGVRVRGSSSANFRKQSLTVETWDERDNDRNIAPFDLPAESDWVLYAPSSEFDRTLLHNSFIYELSRQIGRYAVRLQFVEVFVNTDGGSITMDDHDGVYIWMEKIKRDEHRVDFAPLSIDGTIGGWMLQSNRMQPVPVGGTEHPPNFHTAGPNRVQQGPYGRTFTGGQDRGGDDIPTGYNTFLNFESPSGDTIAPAQIDSIVSWFDEFEDALYGPDFMDPEVGYRAYIDVGSFIDHALLANLALSFDALQLSTYMFKRSDSAKLELGPIWDFDRAYGADSRAADPTQNLEYPRRFLWMPRLFEDPDFEQAYRDRWQTLRDGAFSTANINAIIDQQASEITDEVAAANGTTRWDVRLADMKDWLRRRVEAIDAAYVPRPQADTSLRIRPGEEIALSAEVGTVYYTVDGSDPRVAGGDVSPTATAVAGGTSSEQILVASDAPAAARVPDEAFDQAFGNTWTQPGFDDAAAAGWKHGSAGIGFDERDTFQDLIGLDLQTEMLDVNASLYARIHFAIDGELEAADFLRLKMRYDDGFIAYLNGTQVASANAPSDPTWNAIASTTHRDSEAVEFELFDITPHTNLLRPGDNVLAIHGLNRRSNNDDMLIQAELVSGQFVSTPIEAGYEGDIVARNLVAGQWSAPVVIHVASVGDANADGQFTSSDLVFVFIAGEYEDDTPHNSTFAEGDWNGDGDFTSRDLVAAFQNGAYSASLRTNFELLPTEQSFVLARSALDDELRIRRLRSSILDTTIDEFTNDEYFAVYDDRRLS